MKSLKEFLEGVELPFMAEAFTKDASEIDQFKKDLAKI